MRSGSAEGSGYALGSRLVLTAAHVLKDRERVSVRVEGRQGQVACRVVWARLEEGPQGWDAALLLADEPLSRGVWPAVRWGRLVTGSASPAQAVGFPRVGQAGSDTVTRVQRDGRVLPETGRERDRYVLVGDPGAETMDSGVSPWSGMSGAALWCAGPGIRPLLTGVVAGDPPHLNHTRLEAVPAYVLATDPEFRSLIEEHTGRPILLEAADLTGLTDRTSHPRPPRSPADLLRPDQAVVSFMGRKELLEDLAGWCQDSPQPPAAAVLWPSEQGPVRARLVTGGGGAGKTRLAAELCARMTARGWTAIRLTTSTEAPLDALTLVRRPLLVVVDYAETRVPQLHALLRAIDHDEATTPVRVLALARAAGDWWIRAGEHPSGQILATATVTPVPALHHRLQDRTTAYRQALEDFATALHRLAPAVDWLAHVPALTTPAALPALTRGEFDTPLSVHMAALLALLDSTGTPQPAQPANTLEGRLLGHERKYWDDTADSPGRRLDGERTGTQTRALAVALAALTPASDRDHARALLALLPSLEDAGAAAVRGELATWLRDVYPAPDGSMWGSLQPDRIAEHHIGTQVLLEPALFIRILKTLEQAHAAQALTVLARTAQHPQHRDTITALLREAVAAAPSRLAPAALTTATRTAHPGPLITALTHLTDTTHDINLLQQLSSRVPHTTLALGEWAAALDTVLVEHHGSPALDQAALAASLNNQSIRLAGLGRREDALAAITRAVDIREVLAGQRPDAFLPDLAMSLNNQSNRLADLGRREDALAAITRAAEHYEVLAEQRPDAFLPDLAGALNNQSNRLADLGRREDALATITRAVGHYEVLAGQRPSLFTRQLQKAVQLRDRLERPMQ
ncbi:trypsin-like peptidase domain-containing protein [Streptomyces sp. NPDC059096]|uniref:trypsin-like peptidase domain-containing protein n=1 Tax=Streptomyces sp. NPDC059096 TaxID=3346727 RepID=UPI0036B2CD8A